MKDLLDPAALWARLEPAWSWVDREFLSLSSLAQLLLIGLVLLISRLLARPLGPWLEGLLARREWSGRKAGQFLAGAVPLTPWIVALLLMWLANGILVGLGRPGHLVETAASLLSAWVIIRLTASVVRDPNWSRFIAVTAWTIAALNILGLLQPTIDLLDGLAVTLGETRISVLLVLKGVLILAVLLRLALGASVVLERRVTGFEGLTPSVQVLLNKAVKVTLVIVAIVVSLSAVGINLSAFAFFGGAVGVGVGFGLQKVVSNLVSGVILLLDKSIKPGDVVEVGQTYGRIQSLGARYVSVVTRDGTEYLIPNEDLITNQVINWSFSNRLVRLKIPVGVAYRTDVPRAMALMTRAAEETPRVLDRPKPSCQLKGFGDSAIDLELRIWIDDPENGISNVSSEIRLKLWELFRDNGVEIPFPQRDVHLIPPPQVES